MNEAKKALYWSAGQNNAVRCGLCPHRCNLHENASGICRVRENRGGALLASGYGRVSSVALDPIEKKPLYLYKPGKHVLSIGGYGCNLRCRFCQNFEISKEFGDNWKHAKRAVPDDVVSLALETVPKGNIGVAYTYNEPLIGYEFLYDCARLIRDAGLSNILVTNGYINKEPLEELLPLIDAMNIDLKGFTDDFYESLGGSLEAVKETIALSAKRCHVEVTTLVIPGGRPESSEEGKGYPGTAHSPFQSRGGQSAEPGEDIHVRGNEGEVEDIARWLSSIDPDIPLHLSRFFPRYRMNDRAPTPRETILYLKETAEKHLKNVFAGNM